MASTAILGTGTLTRSFAAIARKIAVTVLKGALSVALVAWVIYDVQRKNPGALVELLHPRHGELLAAAFLSCGTAILLTMFRWHYLARALEIPCTVRETLRAGFVGYLFNLAPMGVMGGDLLKAWLLARGRTGFRTRAFASMVVDRIVGLYMLFVVASAAILATGFLSVPDANIRSACKLALIVTAVASGGLAVLFLPGVTENRLTRALEQLPRVGPMIQNVVESVRLYRQRWPVLLYSCLASVAVHVLFSLGLFLLAAGFFEQHHGLANMLVMGPMSAITGVVPLPMGPMEWVLEYFYRYSPATVVLVAGQGLVVALAYRLITVMLALIGMIYYLVSHREVVAALHEVEAEAETTELVELPVPSDEG